MESKKGLGNVVLDLFKRVIASFDNTSDGFSARKLTAFAAMCLVARLDISLEKYALKTNDYSLLTEILAIHLCFILIVLGIVTVEQVIKLKESNKTNPPT